MRKPKKTDYSLEQPLSRTKIGETFENRPFAQAGLVCPATSRAATTIAETGSSQASESGDLALFLEALNMPERRESQKKPRGFTLAEQCALPRLEEKKPQKKSVRAKALTEPGEKSPAKKPLPEPGQAKASQDDEFLLAMRNTRPLPGKGRQIAQPPKQEARSRRGEMSFAELLGSQSEFSLLYSDEYLEGRAADLDDLLMNRLRSGQMSPEAHIDLHGLNASQAFEELRFFMRDSWYKGLRVVLVVTGRGLNSPSGQGVLRRKVQSWLTQEPFKRVVLGFCTACPKDGGPGSIYVLMRRFRKKGHISWNRLPADADLYPL